MKSSRLPRGVQAENRDRDSFGLAPCGPQFGHGSGSNYAKMAEAYGLTGIGPISDPK